VEMFRFWKSVKAREEEFVRKGKELEHNLMQQGKRFQKAAESALKLQEAELIAQEAKLKVKEVRLEEREKAFNQRMDFTQKRFEIEVGYLKGLLKKML